MRKKKEFEMLNFPQHGSVNFLWHGYISQLHTHAWPLCIVTEATLLDSRLSAYTYRYSLGLPDQDMHACVYNV